MLALKTNEHQMCHMTRRRWATCQLYACTCIARNNKNSSGDEIANMNFLRQYRTHTSRERFPRAYHRWLNCRLIYWRTTFSFCIRRYVVSRACEWCQRYLPCHLLSVYSSVCFCSIYRSLGRISTAAYVPLVLIRSIGHRTLPKIRVGTFLVRSVLQPRKRLFVDANFNNVN